MQKIEEVAPKAAYEALLEHGRDTEEKLRSTFSPPILAAFQRIGNAACDVNPAVLEQAVARHPVQEVPYTALPPDFPIESPDQLPRDEFAIAAQLQKYWQQRDRHDQSSHGFTMYRHAAAKSLRVALTSMDGKLNMSAESWSNYVQAHTAEHNRDFCTLPSMAVEYANRRYPARDDDFVQLERQLIDDHLAFSYPTTLRQTTGSMHWLSQNIAFPLSSEMKKHNSGYAERLLRAATFIIEALEVDGQFHDDITQVTRANYNLVDQFTLRARDEPQDVLGSGVRGTLESVGRAVLPLVSELLRGHERNAVTTADLIARQNVAARVTRLVPLGYVGPVGLQGVGVNDRLVVIADALVTIAPEARDTFAAMNEQWRTKYHYPRLAKYLQEVSDGKLDVQRSERTGLMCPFATPFRSPEMGLSSGVVAEATRLLIEVAKLIPEHPDTPRYSKANPYRPWEGLPFVSTIINGSQV